MASGHAPALIIAAFAVLSFCSIHVDAGRVWNDVDNCGKCNRKCPKAPAHSDRSCKNGMCGYKCKGPWRDCDYRRSNGCETDVTCDPRNCGTCGNRCPVPANSKATCSFGCCGFECKRGFELHINICVAQSPPPPPLFQSPPPPPLFQSPPPPPLFQLKSPPPPPLFQSPPPPPLFQSPPPPPLFQLKSPPPPPLFQSPPPPPLFQSPPPPPLLQSPPPPPLLYSPPA